MDKQYEAAADFEIDNFFKFHKDMIVSDKGFIAHYHNSIEILNITDGSGIIKIDGEEYKVSKNDTIAVNAKQVHAVFPNNTVSYHCLIVNKSFFKKYSLPYKMKYLKPKINDDKINSFFNELEEEANTPLIHSAEKKEALILLLMIYFYRNFSDDAKSDFSHKQGNKAKIVMDAIDYINENFTKNISLEDIGKEIGYSKYYLCRTFKELTSQSPTEYINRLKCAHAAEDLQKGVYTVSEVANKYGFENYSYFSEVFRKYMEKSPSFFKKK